jgi:hypothetical protein
MLLATRHAVALQLQAPRVVNLLWNVAHGAGLHGEATGGVPASLRVLNLGLLLLAEMQLLLLLILLILLLLLLLLLLRLLLRDRSFLRRLQTRPCDSHIELGACNRIE